MKLEISITSVLLEYLKDFETADSAYLAAQDVLVQHLDVDDYQWDALKSVRDSARSDRDDRAVVLARFLVTLVDVYSPADTPVNIPVDSLAVAPADAPADALVDSSVDAPADVPVDAPADAPVDSPVDSSADALVDSPADFPADASADVENIFPVMSAKCKLCPSCVDGRCFFVPDIYDSVFPCQSPAWDDFFKSGGSRSPAPRARASPL